MNKISLPEHFCWTKIGVAGGEMLEGIIRRKELERQAGRGEFWWGIGERPGARSRLLREHADDESMVVFAHMLSAPKLKDKAPDAVYLWQSYFCGVTGEKRPVPAHAIVTSSDVSDRRPYCALQCRLQIRLNDGSVRGDLIDTQCKNLGSGRVPGASQNTTVVSWDNGTNGNGRRYRIAFVADFLDWVELADRRELSPAERRELQDIGREAATVEDWMSLATRLRN